MMIQTNFELCGSNKSVHKLKFYLNVSALSFFIFDESFHV